MMNKWMNFALAGVMSAGLLTGCKSQSGPAQGAANAAQPVPILAQVRGQNSAIKLPTVTLIKSQDQLTSLGVKDIQDLNIDFHKQNLVIVALGEEPTGGYWVNITGLQQVGNTLYVQFTANQPKKGEAATQILTRPFAVAVIPATSANLVLSDPTSVMGQALPKTSTSIPAAQSQSAPEASPTQESTAQPEADTAKPAASENTATPAASDSASTSSKAADEPTAPAQDMAPKAESTASPAATDDSAPKQAPAVMFK